MKYQGGNVSLGFLESTCPDAPIIVIMPKSSRARARAALASRQGPAAPGTFLGSRGASALDVSSRLPQPPVSCTARGTLREAQEVPQCHPPSLGFLKWEPWPFKNRMRSPKRLAAPSFKGI